MNERDHADTKTPCAFLALATRLVRERFPQHPPVKESLLTDVSHGSWGAHKKLGEGIEEGVGWSLRFEREVHGWANEIYEDHWKATAHRNGWKLTLQRKASDAPSATARVWSFEENA